MIRKLEAKKSIRVGYKSLSYEKKRIRRCLKGSAGRDNKSRNR
jgi:hypothetical protein